MKNKLTPITGAIIVGLVGFASATCYQETSYVCLAAGTVFLNVQNGSCNNTYKAQTDWEAYQVYTVGGGGGHTGTVATWCQGPAVMHNCVDGRDYNAGTMTDANQGTHPELDFTSPGC